MEIQDNEEHLIAKMKDDKYKKLIVKFFELLEKKYGVKSKAFIREVDGFKLFCIAVGYVQPFDASDVFDCGDVFSRMIHSRKWRNPTQSTKDKPATWRKMFNKIFHPSLFDNVLSFGFYDKANFKGKYDYYTIGEYNSFEELSIAIDLGSVCLHKRK